MIAFPLILKRATRCPGVRFAPLLLALVVAYGCGKGEEKKAPATQVAAKVNADEITVHQVNYALAKTPNLAPELAERAKKEILNRLIDQQLARQQAIGKKLDRAPGVQQALEAARSEILARAYLEQVAAAQPKPSTEETKKYYAEHPELFAQRRVYSLEEIAFATKDDIAAGLRERAAKARSMQEIAEWLKSRDIRFTANRGVRAAEQIALEVLPKLQVAKDGEIVVIVNGDNHQVIRVTASKTEPVDEAAATPRIEQFLFNRRSREAVDKELRQLKAGAQIEYLGEFAADASTAEAKAKAEAAAKSKALAEAKAKSEAETKARTEEATKARLASETKARLDAEAKARAAQSKPAPVPQQNIEKGIGGLK